MIRNVRFRFFEHPNEKAMGSPGWEFCTDVEGSALALRGNECAVLLSGDEPTMLHCRGHHRGHCAQTKLTKSWPSSPSRSRMWLDGAKRAIVLDGVGPLACCCSSRGPAGGPRGRRRASVSRASLQCCADQPRTSATRSDPGRRRENASSRLQQGDLGS